MALIHKKSRKQEALTAKEFGGRCQIASGAIEGLKADVRTGGKGQGFNEQDYLIENKYTDASYFTLKKSIWEKIEREALRDSFRTPLMQIDIQDLSLVLLPQYFYLDIEPTINAYETTVITKANSVRFVKEGLNNLILEGHLLKGKSLVVKIVLNGSELVLLQKEVFLNSVRK